MDLHDSFNVQRVFQALAEEWGCLSGWSDKSSNRSLTGVGKRPCLIRKQRHFGTSIFRQENQRRVNISYDWGKHTKTGKMCLFYLANKKKGCRGGG